MPYGMIEGCIRFDLGTSDDLDVWLLLTAAEYGLASRDLRFYDQPVRYADAGSDSLWDHLKLAFRHQEAQRGPHGGYVTGATGDWSDFATQYMGMTESMLVSAQLAYVYPRVAELADARGDRPVRRSAARPRLELARDAGHAVDRARLVRARVLRRAPAGRWRHLRRAPAVGDPRGLSRRAGQARTLVPTSVAS